MCIYVCVDNRDRDGYCGALTNTGEEIQFLSLDIILALGFYYAHHQNDEVYFIYSLLKTCMMNGTFNLSNVFFSLDDYVIYLL